MAEQPPAGWYPDPEGDRAPRWWDGRAWAPKVPAAASATDGSRLTRIAIAAIVVSGTLVFALIGAGVGGVGGALSVLGTCGLVIGIIALVRGGIASLAIRTRAMGAVVLATGFIAVFVGGGIGAATTPRPVSFAPQSVGGETPTPSPVVEVTQITETLPIPYDSVTVEDATLASGTRVVSVTGVPGILTVTYTVTTTDGVEGPRVKLGEEVTLAPVSEVTLVGTRVDRQPAAPSGGCDPNYSGCVPIASDVDCAGGSGNGPAYANGPVTVIGSDIYDLDNDNDGVACE